MADEFAINLGDAGANASQPVRIDESNNYAGISTAAKTATQGLQVATKSIKSSGKGGGSDDALKAYVYHDVLELKNDLYDFQNLVKEGNNIKSNGNSEYLEFVAKANRAQETLSQKYGGLADPQIAKAFEEVMGFNPGTKAAELLEEPHDAELERRKAIDSGNMNGTIPVFYDKDGNKDYDQMETWTTQFAAVNSSLNMTTKKNELINEQQKGQINGLVSNMAFSDYQQAVRPPAANDSSFVGAPEAPNTLKFREIVSKLNNNQMITGEEEQFAKQYLQMNKISRINSVKSTMRQPLTPDNLKILNDSYDNNYVQPFLSLIEAGGTKGSADLLTALNNGNKITVEKDQQMILQDPKARKMVAISSLPGVGDIMKNNINNFGTFKDTINGVIDSAFVEDESGNLVNRPKPKLEQDEEKLRTQAPQMLEYVKSTFNTKTYDMADKASADMLTVGMYNTLKPAGANVESTMDVAASFSNKNFFTNYSNMLNSNVVTPESKLTLGQEVGKNLANLQDYISKNSTNIPSQFTIKRDSASGVFYYEVNAPVSYNGKTGEKRVVTNPNQFRTIGDAISGNNQVDKLITALNSYNMLSAVQYKTVGIKDDFINATFGEIQDGTIPVLSGGLKNVGGDKYVYLPKNNVHLGMYEDVFKDNFYTEFKKADGSRADALQLDLAPLDGEGETTDVNTVIDRLINREGGYVNDNADKGGATKYGITKKTLADYRGEDVSEKDVESLTTSEAREIYLQEYYYGAKLNLLPEAIRENVFDWVVHSGQGNAIKQLQKLAGIKATGTINQATIRALSTLTNDEISAARINFYRGIVEKDPTQKKFLTGWVNRARDFTKDLGKELFNNEANASDLRGSNPAMATMGIAPLIDKYYTEPRNAKRRSEEEAARQRQQDNDPNVVVVYSQEEFKKALEETDGKKEIILRRK